MSQTPSRSRYRDSVPDRVPWGELAVFLGVTMAGITVVAVLWRSYGAFDDDGDALLFGGIGMFTPALGLLVLPAGGSPRVSAAQLHAGRTGEQPEYARYEGCPPARPARSWIHRYPRRTSDGKH